MEHLAAHHHGKSKVRVGRVWRRGSVHEFVEWTVDCVLDSDMGHAFMTSSNQGMTATDTQKNTVYYMAKKMSEPCAPEVFAVALCSHFVETYPLVLRAKVSIEVVPWGRFQANGKNAQPHDHGFIGEGEGCRTCVVSIDKAGNIDISAGIRNLKVLKTTQSGYAGFIHDKFTTLPDVSDRILATAISCTWRYTKPPSDFDAAFDNSKSAMLTTFFGPPKGGVFSPSVQNTLFLIAKSIIQTVPEVDSVHLAMPNLHFLPCTPVNFEFEDDVYIATSEPHGFIEAVVTRGHIAPHARF